jgi:chromosome segregation ATPase
VGRGTDDTEHVVVDLETRVGTLEQEVAQIRKDEMEVHQLQIRVLHSLRETQIEHGKTLQENGAAISGLRTEMAGLRTEMAGIRTEVGSLQTEVGRIRTEVGSLRTEVNGLRETQVEHGRLLHQVGVGMAGIAQSLDYLINEQAKSQS